MLEIMHVAQGQAMRPLTLRYSINPPSALRSDGLKVLFTGRIACILSTTRIMQVECRRITSSEHNSLKSPRLLTANGRGSVALKSQSLMHQALACMRSTTADSKPDQVKITATRGATHEVCVTLLLSRALRQMPRYRPRQQ